MNTPNKPLVLLRRDEVLRRTGFSVSGLYEAMAQGRFKRPVKNGGIATWPEHEGEDFIRQRIAERDATAPRP